MQKFKRTIPILIAILCVAVVLCLFKTDMKRWINTTFFHTPRSYAPLTQAQKLADFESFYDNILTSFPMLDEIKEYAGIDFIGRKETYESLVRATKDDFAFYCVMNAIVADLPSFHTDLVVPSVRQYQTLHCYNSRAVLATRGIDADAAYWTALLKEACAKNTGVGYLSFVPVDNAYLLELDRLSTDILPAEEITLCEIDGVSVDDYIKTNLSLYSRYFSAQKKKPFRTRLVFNDQSGKQVELLVQDANGRQASYPAFVDLELETVFWYSMNFIDNSASRKSSVYSYKDETKDIFYLQINDFANSQGKDVANLLRENTAKNVILDLRENYGGSAEYASKYVYPYLFQENLTQSYTWYVMDSAENKKIQGDNFFQRFVTPLSPVTSPMETLSGTSRWLYSTTKHSYKGKARTSRRVICLVSHNTGSAADSFVSFLKENRLATLVGENTGGEGLAGSYIADRLPNSGLVYIFMPGKGFNPDRSDNSIFGTVADMDSTLSQEGYIKRLQIERTGADSNLYDQRLLWDTTLQVAINEF